MTDNANTAAEANAPLDRRTRYTLMVIHDAFFELLDEMGFSKITVSDICRRAQINRGTFYLHYEDKYALLKTIIDEALDAAPLMDESSAYSMCQRVPATDAYAKLYEDNDAFPYIANRVMERGASAMVPDIMQRTGLDRDDAMLLFAHSAYGNLAVNRLLGWKRGKRFERVQKMISVYSGGGLAAVKSWTTEAADSSKEQ